MSLLIHGFLSVNARLLIAFGTAFYAIIKIFARGQKSVEEVNSLAFVYISMPKIIFEVARKWFEAVILASCCLLMKTLNIARCMCFVLALTPTFIHGFPKLFGIVVLEEEKCHFFSDLDCLKIFFSSFFIFLSDLVSLSKFTYYRALNVS